VGDVVNIEFDQLLKKNPGEVHVAAAVAETTVWSPPVSHKTQEDEDIDFMKQAIELGDNEGRLTAPPNPWVASLLVGPGGIVLGRGLSILKKDKGIQN